MVEVLGWLVICVIIADFVVGFVHWMEDTYLDGMMEYLGFINEHIAKPNVLHHVDPRHMTKSTVLVRNYIQCMGAAIASVILYFTPYNFWQIHCIFWISSIGNEIHNINHKLDGELNPIERFLIDSGVIQQKKKHMMHHKDYLTHYCTIIDFNNAWMERLNFWRKLEFTLSIIGIHPQRENRRDSK